MKNSGDNVFQNIPVADGQAALVEGFLNGHDFSPNTRRAFTNDLRKFASWFTTANKEPFAVGRVTVRDITDFRGWLRKDTPVQALPDHERLVHHRPNQRLDGSQDLPGSPIQDAPNAGPASHCSG